MPPSQETAGGTRRIPRGLGRGCADEGDDETRGSIRCVTLVLGKHSPDLEDVTASTEVGGRNFMAPAEYGPEEKARWFAMPRI